ncbi:MAG: prolyl-tRNA synthetase [Parcubacteria group bacterium]|nr:prolyl-tRNA synthetase [Parcubacteria group bacterium]
MRQSTLFTRTRKEAPKDEVAKNAQLLIRAGYIHKEMAGVYSLLPLGLRVMRNIERIIRQEMNAIGGQEVLLSTLQDKDIWIETDRWNLPDLWLKTSLNNPDDTGLGATHEEPLTRIMASHISSHRDLPAYAYQFQNKFRHEMRAKSGIMRGREFLMKDFYSFHKDEADLDAFYDRMKEAYKTIFERAGIGDRTYLTSASGGVFSKYSHEFQTICDAGEDLIYYNAPKKVAINKEVYNDEAFADSGLSKDDVQEAKSIEVGNIFKLGTRFSAPLKLNYTTEEGEQKPVVMGSYGIGLGRLMGTVVEVLSDEKGIVWPKEIAPYQVHLVSLAGNNSDIAAEAERTYNTLTEHGIEVLFDDRDVRAGEKFADAELIGIPKRVVVSEKTVSAGGIEVSERKTGETKLVPESAIPDFFLNE